MKIAQIPKRQDGFIDVPVIIRANRVREFYPGLIDNGRMRQEDFPSLMSSGRRYFDSAATSQEPLSVRKKMLDYALTHARGSNHSKNSREAREAQGMYDDAKAKLAHLLHAGDYLTAFTAGTTDSSNWVATRFPFEKGDLLLLSELEHNSQILTARNSARRAGADVKYIPVSVPDGALDLDYIRRVVESRKHGKILINLVQASNLTGTVSPVMDIRRIVGDRAYIYLDMAQSAGHMIVDLNALDVDFAGVSAHKMNGPMGIGAIFINSRSKRAERILGNHVSGGSAVELVSRDVTVYEKGLRRFEPGTQDIEGAIEWGFAIDYISRLGMDWIRCHDKALGGYFMGELQKIEGVRIYGPQSPENRSGIVTFNIGSFLRKNYEKVAIRLDELGDSVRDGCFCVHIGTAKLLGISKVQNARAWLLQHGMTQKFLNLPNLLVKLPGAVRFSFTFYNTLEEVHQAVLDVRQVRDEIFGVRPRAGSGQAENIAPPQP